MMCCPPLDPPHGMASDPRNIPLSFPFKLRTCFPLERLLQGAAKLLVCSSNARVALRAGLWLELVLQNQLLRYIDGDRGQVLQDFQTGFKEAILVILTLPLSLLFNNGLRQPESPVVFGTLQPCPGGFQRDGGSASQVYLVIERLNVGQIMRGWTSRWLRKLRCMGWSAVNTRRIIVGTT